jgi:hypothetical protein
MSTTVRRPLTTYLDWTDDAEEVLAQHYSGDVLVHSLGDLDFAMFDPPPPEPQAVEYCVEYAADPSTRTCAGLLVQELPRVATLAMAENMCRIHGIGADLLDVTTMRLTHRLDSRGWLIPIGDREERAA